MDDAESDRSSLSIASLCLNPIQRSNHLPKTDLGMKERSASIVTCLSNQCNAVCTNSGHVEFGQEVVDVESGIF